MRILICPKAGKACEYEQYPQVLREDDEPLQIAIGAFGYITDSWMNCLRDRGHEVQRWDGNPGSWNLFDPDLYIGSSGHKQPIPTQRRTKIALHVNSWGPVIIDDRNESKENISESDTNIKWVIERKPDVVFGYGFQQDEILWTNWTKKAGIPWIPMPTAGDKIIFHRRENTERKHDIVYLGGRWPYKSYTIDRYLFPILKSSLSCKVYGWGEWPPDLCSGQLPENQATEFLCSGKIGPCISERHTHQYGIDVPERVFKLALCGTLAIHDRVPRFNTLFPDIIMGNNPKDLLEKCLYYAKHDEERQRIAEKQRQFVLNNHTYHHRLHILLKAVGFADEAQGML